MLMIKVETALMQRFSQHFSTMVDMTLSLHDFHVVSTLVKAISKSIVLVIGMNL